MCITHILNLHIISLSFIHEFRNYKEYHLKIKEKLIHNQNKGIGWPSIIFLFKMQCSQKEIIVIS